MRHYLLQGWAAAALALLVGPAAPAGARSYFSDVPPTHWAYHAVNELAALGILKGYPPAPAPRMKATPPARAGAKGAPGRKPPHAPAQRGRKR